MKIKRKVSPTNHSNIYCNVLKHDKTFIFKISYSHLFDLNQQQ